MNRLLIFVFALFYGELFNAKNEATVYDDHRPMAIEDCDIHLDDLMSQMKKSKILGPSFKSYVVNDLLGLLDF